MKLKGANYDESMIEFKLKEKNFPAEIAQRFSRDFLILTNGIPLFVEMIQDWELSNCYLTNPPLNKNINEENQNLIENHLNSSEESINSILTNEVENIMEILKIRIDDYIIEKVKKFKSDHYDGFSLYNRMNFKDVLQKFEDELSPLDLETYADCLDYQLMDFEYLDASKRNEIIVSSDYPELVKHYENIMEIKIDPKVKIGLFTNKMKSYIFNNKPNSKKNYNSLAGNQFEEIVKYSFSLKSIFNQNQNHDEKAYKFKNFD